MTKTIIDAAEFKINSAMIDQCALYVIKKLQENGFDACIVGGGVRDLLVNKRPKDFDVATAARPEEIKSLFKRQAFIIGRRFKIVHIIFETINPDKIINKRPIVERHVIEVSTYRSSIITKTSIGKYGRILFDNVFGTQSEDANRRDFTVNALLYDPIANIIIDYHNGLSDIKKKTIKMIGSNPQDRCVEDPVRMLRAIRLAVKLDFTIDKKLSACFSKIKHLLVHEPKSRLYEEMLKILLSGAAFKCIKRLQQEKLPQKIFPLFDQVFFSKKPSVFALKVIEKTDARLIDTNDVSIIFILAGLLWDFVNKEWQQKCSSAMTKCMLTEAIDTQKEFAATCAISSHPFNCMKDLWLLQSDFQSPNAKRLVNMIKMNRFRQAWHLYDLRHDCGEVDHLAHTWWCEYLDALKNRDQVVLKGLLEKLPKVKNTVSNDLS